MEQHFLVMGLSEVLNFSTLGLILIGVLLGIVVGAIPGLNVTMAVLIVFPFTFAMEPQLGISFMMSVFVGGLSGGVISNVMLGIPGTPSSVATLYDGYPLGQKGEAGRAIGVAVLASFVGTVISFIILSIFGPLIAQFSMNFRPWEITALIVFALTLVISLSSGALLKGLISAVVGLLIATVGIDRSGNARFDFGSSFLANGFDILPVMIGLFAFSQLLNGLDDTSKSKKVTNTKVIISYIGIIKDVWKYRVNVIRSSLIGAFIGALPGTGATLSNFLAYDQAKKFSKTPNKFGKGTPEGVMAPEAANSAVAGGALVPTLALGIPGDLITSIMLGVLILHGITPGPRLFESQPGFIGTIYISILISGIIMVILHMILIHVFTKVSLIPQHILLPIVLILASVGSFALNNSIYDVWVLFYFGIVGYFLVKANVPLTPMILGLVLGSNLETNLFRALELQNSLVPFVTRPISLILILLSVISVVLSIFQERKMRKTENHENRFTVE